MLRKFICLSAGLAACGVAGTAQAGPKVLQKIDGGIRVDPISIAPLYPDGTIGEYRPYVSSDDGACYGAGYDSFEAVRADSNDPCGVGKGFMADGTASGGFDPFCNINGSGDPCIENGYRWFFGTTYVQGGRRSSGVSATNNGGGTDNICRLQTAWYNAFGTGETDPNGNTVGNIVIVINTYDGQWDQFCGTDEPNDLGGVILNFGTMPSGGYFYTDVDLADAGLALTVPTGDHGNQIQFFYDVDLTQQGFSSQIMLWGPKDPAAQGENAPIVYDDDNGDGVFDNVVECFDYSGAVPCPDPSASMVVFYGEGEPPCQTFGVDQLIGGEPATFSVSSPDNPGSDFGVIYFLNRAQGEAFRDCANQAGSNSLNELVQCYGGDPRDTLACQGRLNNSGNGSCTTPVPRAASGRTVTFVSVVRGSGGWCAESLTQTIL